MKILRKKVFVISVAVLLTLGIVFMAYSIIAGQGKLSPYEINVDIDTDARVLFATHKTDRKDAIMEEIVQYYRDKPIYISVIDAHTLSDVRIEEWDGVVIFSAIEFGQPPKEVLSFVRDNEGSDDMALFLTVNSGRWNTDLDIDAITSASRNIKSNEIVMFIDSIIAK